MDELSSAWKIQQKRVLGLCIGSWDQSGHDNILLILATAEMTLVVDVDLPWKLKVFKNIFFVSVCPGTAE